jgi:uncharacterized protein
MYVQIARLMCRHDYMVWRFDCYGVGDSDGEFSETSYESELDDYRAVLLKALHEASHGECVLVGHSMGTSLAALLAGENQSVSRLLLLSPCFGRVTWIDNLFSSEELEQLQTLGTTVRKGVEIKASFVEGFQSERPLSVAASLSIPTTIAYGAADEFYSLESVNQVAAILRTKNIILVPNADHNFLRSGVRSTILGKLEEEIRSWRI